MKVFVLLSLFALVSCRPEPRACGGSFSGSSGTIQSPNYPSNYGNYESCTWTVNGRSGQAITLTFSEFDVESHSNCNYDKMSLYDGSKLMHTYCGAGQVPVFTTSAGNDLKVVFTSDWIVTRKGFSATYSVGGAPPPTQPPTQPSGGTGTKPAVCGKPAIPRSSNRIVGGQAAKRGSLPWQISLRDGTFHFCGGSIISDTFVVTAAHCIDGNDGTATAKYSVVAGEHNKNVNEGSEQTVQVKRGTMHPSYNSNTFENDIAILELSGSLTFNNYVHPVCIPSTPIGDNLDVIISGWGTLSSGGSSPSTLQEVVVPTIPDSQCMRSVSYGSEFKPSSMLCAGLMAGGKDSCQGDSGGPLVREVGGEFNLYGVVSWGYGCAGKDKPGVYSKVTSLVPFIESTTGIDF